MKDPVEGRSMMESYVNVPKGMLDAATAAATSFDSKVAYPPYIEMALAAALRWQRDNPPQLSAEESERVERMLMTDKSESVKDQLQATFNEILRGAYRRPKMPVVVTRILQKHKAQLGGEMAEIAVEAFNAGMAYQRLAAGERQENRQRKWKSEIRYRGENMWTYVGSSQSWWEAWATIKKAMGAQPLLDGFRVLRVEDDAD